MSEYQALTAAGRTLNAIKCGIAMEDGAYTSAAWKMVFHAEEHVTKLAEAELRGVLVACYKRNEIECDGEQHVCESCGKTMCFSHSVQAGGSWSDETVLVCVDCVAR